MKNTLFLLLLCFSGTLFAQDTTKAVDGKPGHAADTALPARQKPAQARDSLKPARRRPGLFTERGKPERRKFDSTLFTNNTELTTSDYLINMEKIFQLLSSVPETTSSFIHLPEIEDQFDQEDSALAILKDRILTTDERALNIRNLQMYNTLLDALNSSTDTYANYLELYDKKLDNVKSRIGEMRKDTLMLRIFRDSALKDTFQSQLQELKGKWRQADSLVKLNEAEIDDLKARASANAITIDDLLYRVDSELKTLGNKIFGKERRYLWEPRSSGAPRNFSKDAFQRSVDSEKKLVKYYFVNSRSKRLWLLLTGLAFFYWIWFNFRSLRRLDRLKAIEGFRFRYINPLPWSGSLLFILSLAPLFDLHAPAIYIESIQFLLMLLLTIMFRKRLPRNLFYGWCIFILLFLFLPVTGILGLPVSLQRWAYIIQNSLSVALGLIFLFGSRLTGPGRLVRSAKSPGKPDTTGGGKPDTPESPGPAVTGDGNRNPDAASDIAYAASYNTDLAKMPGRPKVIVYAAILYVFFNLLAVVCNLAGRVTLSQIFGATSIYAFAQTVSLAVFVQLVVEAFLLQIQTSRVRKKYPEQFDSVSVSRSIRRFSTALAIILWLIVFTTNLNIFDALNDLLTALFTDPRQVGSLSFTLSGIALFLGIIWIANFLQRYITYFFGDTGDDAAIDDKGQRSKLLVTRLILLVGGFLVAVAASGLPIDKITVILGALGVGIGLGLQSIVNNFVSGIILIFDRPLRIGDTVEIGDKKGRVKEIGIRSSTLLTDEGAEVIIPNGDVLSHNIVNWTLSNNHVRVSLSFTIDKPAHPEDIEPDTIKEIIKANPNVLERREPEIILSSLSSKTIEIKVFFWSKDFGKTNLTAGDIRTSIYEHLDKKGITVL
jgi:potassium efflux system protein